MILYLYRRMSKLVYNHKSMLVIVSCTEILRIDTEHTSEFILSHFPDMEVFDLTFSISFDHFFDLLYDHIISRSIYEDSRGISHEKIGPTKDEDRPEYSHSRIKPIPTIIFCSEKRYYSKYRSECISDDVEICRLQIEIFVSCMVMLIIMMFVFVVSDMIVSVSTV